MLIFDDPSLVPSQNTDTENKAPETIATYHRECSRIPVIFEKFYRNQPHMSQKNRLQFFKLFAEL